MRRFNLVHFLRKREAYDSTDGYFEPRYEGVQTESTRKWLGVQESAVVAVHEVLGLFTGKGWMDEQGRLTEAGKKALYDQADNPGPPTQLEPCVRPTGESAVPHEGGEEVQERDNGAPRTDVP